MANGTMTPWGAFPTSTSNTSTLRKLGRTSLRLPSSRLTRFLLNSRASIPIGYSAQQAEIEHRHMVETVQVIMEIQLTDTYPAFLPNPSGQTTGTPWNYIARPSNFWQDFQIQVISEKKTLPPFKYSGEPDYLCGDGGCSLAGATVQLEFLADAFAPGDATIEIDPPEGDQVVVDFDLSSFR